MGRLTAIVLGSAAGGGFPQWNCRCAVCRLAWDGDPRVTPRTQASLAVSADGEHWTLLNASPDLRAQLAATPALHPRDAARQPDRGRGADRRRDRSDRGPVEFARAPALHAVRRRRTRWRRSRGNPMFGALAPDVVTRRAVAPGAAIRAARAGFRRSCSWCRARCRSIWRRATPETSVESGANVGVEIKSDGDNADVRSRRRSRHAGAARAACARGRHPVRRHAVHRRRDDRVRHRRKDRPPHGPHADRRRGRLARRAQGAWQAAHLHPHQQHQSDPDRRLARTPAGRGRRLGGGRGRAGDQYCEADDAGRTGSRAARDRREALSPPASVSRAAARRQMHQGPGAGLGAQSLLLSGDDPDQGREPDRALR